MKNEYYLKESPSGAFFVMLDGKPIGGFHSKEHANLFLKALTNQQ